MRNRNLRRAGAWVGVALVALTAQAASAGKPAAAKADAILFDGKFLTMDARGSVVQAVAVRGGRIVATGTDAAMRRWQGAATRMVDMKGQTVLPGFIDGHVHPQVAIRMKSYLDAHYAVIPTLAGMLAATQDRARSTPAGAR